MAGMTLLDPPIRGDDLASGLPIQIIAMDLVGESCIFLVVDIEGLLSVKHHDQIKFDWRYDLNKHRWFDAAYGLDEDG